MQVILYALLPIILLVSVSASVVLNANLLSATELAVPESMDTYEDVQEKEEDMVESGIDVGGTHYSNVEEYLNSEK